MNDAKKMIVGRTWKAKMDPRLPGLPGDLASDPKTNCAPSLAKLNRTTKALLMYSKMTLPTVVLRTMKANANWEIMPTMTSRQLIARLFEEKRKARAVTRARPKSPLRTDWRLMQM